VERGADSGRDARDRRGHGGRATRPEAPPVRRRGGRWPATSALKSLSIGAAVVLSALADLRDRGLADSASHLPGLALATGERNRARPDFAGVTVELPAARQSLSLRWETGILLTAFRLAPSQERADELHVNVRANVGSEAEESMWSAPGTLITARLMLKWTGDERWREAWRESSDALLARRNAGGTWAQRLYGVYGAHPRACPRDGRERSRSRAAPRPEAAGDARAGDERRLRADSRRPRRARELAFGRGRDAREQAGRDPRAVVSRRTRHRRRRGRVPRRGRGHAPQRGGADLGGRATSGREGSSICHGTAGNGDAFLEAFVRTGDERWRARARRFAVHALEQVRRGRRARGRGRCSLFTGDLGVALYLADCLDARAAFPLLDG